MCPMWENDIIYGGEQLEPAITLDTQEYVLWECGIVAENVVTSLGADGTKVEVIISACRDDNSGRMLSDPPAKYGTFASAIVGKVRLKEDGDLPAVIVFSKVKSSQAANQDAFVMTFVRPWEGDPASPLPPLSPYSAGTVAETPKVDPPKVDPGTGRYYTLMRGKKVLGDPAPKRAVELAKRQALEEEDAAVADLTGGERLPDASGATK